MSVLQFARLLTTGLPQSAGEALGLLKRRVKGDLERFKQFIESRGDEAGAWRGEVQQDPAA